MDNLFSSKKMTSLAAGTAALSAGRYLEALGHFRRICDRSQGEGRAYKGLAICLQQLGRNEEAEDNYHRALGYNQQDPEIWANLGVLHQCCGEVAKARRCLEKATALAPEDPDIIFNLANLYGDTGQPEAAVKAYRRTLELAPDHCDALINWGVQSKALGKLSRAERCYRQALSFNPQCLAAYTNLSTLLWEQGDLEAAKDFLEQGLKYCGADANLLYNLGNTCKSMQAYQDALEAYTSAIQLRPDMAEAHWNKALTHLAMGQYREGWREYEWRIRKPDWSAYYPCDHYSPLWQGEDISERTLLVHDEQGFGDTIQFSRYLPLIKQRCKTLIFETRRQLAPLFDGCPHIDHLVLRPASANARLQWDYHIPLLSLPNRFQTQVSSIPSIIPYLIPNPQRVHYYNARLDKTKVNVGLVWAGNPKHHNDEQRSLPLEAFHHLFTLKGVTWHALQKGNAAKEAFLSPFDSILHSWEETLNSFADTAALIWALDYIVSVDTAVAHLAGALGKPFRLILPSDNVDWRWVDQTARQRWYPTLMMDRIR